MKSITNRDGHQKVSMEGQATNMMRNASMRHSAKHEKKADKDVDLLPADKRKS